MIINTYEGWLAGKIKELRQNLAKSGEAAKYKCHSCFGSGSITDHGEITGEEFEAKCPECDGCGHLELEPDEIDMKTARVFLTSREYQKELLDDLRAVARAIRKQEWELLSEHGFKIYCLVESRTQVIESHHAVPGYREITPAEVTH